MWVGRTLSVALKLFLLRILFHEFLAVHYVQALWQSLLVGACKASVNGENSSVSLACGRVFHTADAGNGYGLYCHLVKEESLVLASERQCAVAGACEVGGKTGPLLFCDALCRYKLVVTVDLQIAALAFPCSCLEGELCVACDCERGCYRISGNRTCAETRALVGHITLVVKILPTCIVSDF